MIFGWWQFVFLNIIVIPISPPCQLTLIFLTFISIPVRKVRILLYIPTKTISQWFLSSIRQNTATIVSHTDTVSDLPSHIQWIMVLDDDWSWQFIYAFVLLVVDIVRFDYWAVFFDWVGYFLFGTVPFNYTFMLWVQYMRSETLYFLLVLLQIQLFLVVPVSRHCSWNVRCEKWSHKINIYYHSNLFLNNRSIYKI